MNLSDFEDKPIIGTKRLKPFQRMCSMAGAFAVYEAKQAGLPITSVKDGKIVKEYPDGKVEILGDAHPWVPVKKRVYKLPKV
ncbi:MAG: hypothetical protein LBK40_03450 [Spirochaetaceae bacterium]|jgi:hypothetical protein|nr:hypothetical protein [Spirochaetaceae bacterium]